MTEIHKKIVGAIIVRKGNLLAAYAKPQVPFPQKDKLSELILQAELVLNISKRNTDLFGQVKVAHVQHDILTIFIFPLPEDTTLSFAMQGTNGVDYKYEEVTRSIFAFLRTE